MNEKAKQFWESCSLEYAHNEIRKHLHDYNTLTKFWETNFLSRIDFKDKIVLDYGIGGGYLGKYLFDTRCIKKYIGVDIAERSLNKAKEVLHGHKGVELYITNDYYNTYTDKVDIFICQAVIQHFFSLDYLMQFLKKIESLSPDTIMLQITYAKETKINTSYKNEGDVARACCTNSDYISQYLSSYKLTYKGDVLRNSYQFLIFTKV